MRPRTNQLIETECAYCHSKLMRSTERNKRFFCSQSHYWSWLRENRPVEEIWYKHTDGKLLAELQRVANVLGHIPTFQEMEQVGTIYSSTYSKRFGSWRIACASITNPQPLPEWNIDSITPEDGGWLSGIADGESTFRIAKHNTSYSAVWGLQVRADDFYIVEEVRRIIGTKAPLRYWIRDTDRKNGIKAGDAVRFYVRDIPTIHTRLIPIFQRFPLRSKKKYEFLMFIEAVDLLHNHQADLQHRRYTLGLRQRLDELYHAISNAKIYKGIPDC